MLDGDYRQVMISARELAGELPERADTWVNRTLQFTHGYGLAMSLAAQEGEEGAPTFLVQDLPPVTKYDLEIDQAGIFYGEMMAGYRIVNTGVEEFDYPKGDEKRLYPLPGQRRNPSRFLLEKTAFCLGVRRYQHPALQLSE